MKISIITPSIRPKGLEMTFNTLKKQTFKDYQWLPRLSIPGKKPDLCHQFNQALDEANGELIVFLQDYIELPDPETLEHLWEIYQEHKYTAWTFSLGDGWDWRSEGRVRDVEYHQWEIDFGMIPHDQLDGLSFDEAYDSGFGWENVDLAYKLHKQGQRFRVNPFVKAKGHNHEKIEPHPYKKNPNKDLWLVKKKVIDLMYD